MTLESHIQKSELGRYVILYVLDATELDGNVYRFCSSLDEGAAVVFDGNTYQPIPIEAEGFETKGKGLPQPTMRISGLNSVARALVNTHDGGVGMLIQRIKTFDRFLDNGAEPDPTATFAVGIYRVERKAEQTDEAIVWDLSALTDLQGIDLPRRPILRDICTHTYRFWNGVSFDYTKASCPYTGTDYFDQDGNVVADPADDACGLRLSDCKLRFGAHAELPYWGFPGVARVRIR